MNNIVTHGHLAAMTYTYIFLNHSIYNINDFFLLLITVYYPWLPELQ